MIEILNIFYLFVTFFIIFSFPLNNILLKKNLKKYNFNIFEIYSFNILFLLTCFLLLSFFKLNVIYIFFIFLVFSLINLFFLDWSEYKKKITLLIVLVIFLLSYSLEISTYPYLEWDAAVNWIFKVLNFKYNYSFKNLSNVPGFAAYPHLGTYLWAIFWKASFIDYEYTGRLVFIFIYLTSFFALVNNFKLNTIQKILSLIFIIIICFDRILINGYQEPLMFSLCIIFMILAQKIVNEKKLYLNYLLLILCANLILWTKNEGMLILIFLSFFILFKREITKKNKIILFSLFIFLIILKKIIFLHYFDSSLFVWKGYEFIKISEFFSYEIIQRLPFLFFQVLISFIKYPVYILFIILMVVTLINEKNLIKNSDFILFFLINVAIAISIFYFLSDPNWKHHTKVALDRFLYQTSGVYLIFIMKYFDNFIFKRNNNK